MQYTVLSYDAFANNPTAKPICILQTRLNRNYELHKEKTMGIFHAKKYMTLKDVRLFYDKKTDQIRLTSSDSRIYGGLNMLFNPGRRHEIEVRYAMIMEGIIPEDKYQDQIPSNPVITEEVSMKPYSIPFGEGPKGTVYFNVADMADPGYGVHLNITGAIGSGKTEVLKSIVKHCLNYPEKWDVIIGWSHFGKNEDITKEKLPASDTIKIAEDYENLNSILTEIIESIGVSSATNKRTLLALPGLSHILYCLKSATGYSRENALYQEIMEKIGYILRIGRSAGIHVVMETTAADELSERVNNNFYTNVIMGKLHRAESIDLLDIDISNRTYGAKIGRGIIASPFGLVDFQSYTPLDKIK